jgi:DNA-directed RNA polymerase subunit RPC12/RpoP
MAAVREAKARGLVNEKKSFWKVCQTCGRQFIGAPEGEDIDTWMECQQCTIERTEKHSKLPLKSNQMEVTMKVKGLSQDCKIALTNGRLEFLANEIRAIPQRLKEPANKEAPDEGTIKPEDISSEIDRRLKHFLEVIFNKDCETTEEETKFLKEKDLI